MTDSLVPFDGLLETPINRAAYSDRTAFIMATMSKLAYIQFEEATSITAAISEALQMITGKTDPKDQEKAVTISEKFSRDNLETLLKGVSGGADREGNHNQLKESVAELKFTLVRTCSVHIPLIADTQAFLARLDTKGRPPFLVLSFRGTEPKKPADIKSDLDATPMDLGRLGGPGGTVFVKLGEEETEAQKKWPKVRVHPGFWKAFSVVKKDLLDIINAPENKDLPLYITGHSLGGALAVVATYVLDSDRIAACYTFGGPRVGNLQFGQCMKPPVYRVINASDIVPRVPPGVLIDVLTTVLRAVPAVPFLDDIADFLERFRGYRHYGDMRYLDATESAVNSDNGATIYPKLLVRSNPPQISRWYWLARRWAATWGRAAVSDHSIDIYVSKLAYWAHVRSREA